MDTLDERTPSALRPAHRTMQIDTLFSRNTDMVVVSDAAGTILYINPATTQATGYHHDELVGQPLSVLLQPNEQTESPPTSGRPPTFASHDIRSTLRLKDGGWRWVVGTHTNMFDTPAVGGLVTIVRADDTTGESSRNSDADYRSLFEEIDEGFCTVGIILDEQGRPYDYRFLSINRTFEQQTGLVGAVGRTARELVPTLEQFWFDMYGGVGLTGVPQRFEQASAPMGRWFDVYTFRIGDPVDRKVAIWFKDVTARKTVEEALRLSEERFRAVADLVPDLLWSTDAAGNTDWYNFGWLEYTGQTLEEARASDWLAALHPEDQVAYLRTYGVALERGEPLRQEFRLKGTDGTYRWFLVQARPMLDETFQPVRWYGAATDIHQEWLALGAAQVARQSAEAALQTRDHFLSIASHELRTPLTSIIGYAQMLNRRAKQGKIDVERLTKIIVHQAERLKLLLEQMLDLSRLQEDQFSIEYVQTDMVAHVRSIVDDFRASLPLDNRHAVEYEGSEPSILTMVDANRLEQVFVNLLSNAVKYSPNGGTVHVRIRRDDSTISVEVEDHGLGIPDDVMLRLFDPFFRGSNVGPDISGFGLGLHIVHQIVQRHGGHIEVTSVEGEGSTFRVVLPLVAPSLQDDTTLGAPDRRDS